MNILPPLAFMPCSDSSPTMELFRLALERGRRCACIHPPELQSLRSAKEESGEWRTENEFHLRPKTLFPTRESFPFNGNPSWNGSEIFSNPRAGKIVRDQGFAPVEFLVVEHFHLIPMIRHFQAEKLVVIISRKNLPTRNSPAIIQKRWREVAEDADVLISEKRVVEPLNLRAEPAALNLFDEKEPGWANTLLSGLTVHS